ncbi:MAG: Uma2 family endonuclease [Polyangiaceae bacterium]|jgi:Uma2 family endonuclease|nr:Uma2 family endonuclease [Polyangiaceae bacterium]
MAQPAASLSPRVVCYDGASPPPSWDLDETPVPEARSHDQAAELMRRVLEAVGTHDGLPVYVPRNLALRFHEARPRVGLDPDVALYVPPPPNAEQLSSVRTWEAGHAAPKVALEVVSAGHPSKDYGPGGLERYAASGTGELWVFDPLLAGPRDDGGPYRLQVWVRVGPGQLERVYAGEGPARSPYLRAWLVVTDKGQRLRISDDQAGRRLWPTAEEAERAAKKRARAAQEAERAAKEAERAAKERALAAQETERAAKEAERAAKERALAAQETERAAKEAALDELAQLRAELAALRGGR